MMFFIGILYIGFVQAGKEALVDERGEFLPHIRLAKDLMDQRRYDNRVRPVVNHTRPTSVSFSMSLYQILAINEKQQNVDLNVWVIQKWVDDFLGWDPHNYGMINTTILPFDAIWLPDTYIYNSVVMNREETERYINVVISTNYWKGERGAEIKFMYPALYRTSCLLDIRFFPYDQQTCKLTISSWTSSKSDIDYYAEFDAVNLDNFITNEEWVVVSFHIERIEEKFVCCPEPWVLLEANLVVRRKPLYYIVNLVIPTSVITMVAVTGFFTAASTSSERREKLSLGIDSLLAMSILMMMVSEQMPTTSDYVPLFGLFYLSIILIIFIGTLFTAFILNIHLQKMYSKPVPPLIAFIFFAKIAKWLKLRAPTQLLELWTETGVHFETQKVGQGNKKRVAKNLKSTSIHGARCSRNEILMQSTSLSKSLSPPQPTVTTIDKEAQIREKWRAVANAALMQERSREASTTPNGRLSIRPPSSIGDGMVTPTSPIEPGPLMLCTSAMSATENTLFESKLRRRLLQQKMIQGDRRTVQIKTNLPNFLCADKIPCKWIYIKTADMKRKYALEWEYLATVLDRLLLIFFTLVVIFVTFLMILVGEAMHLSYTLEQNMKEMARKKQTN